MLSGAPKEAITASSNTDSCQTTITPQVAAPQANTQTSAATIAKPTVPRKTLAQQEPAIFAIWGLAIIYIAVLVVNSIIKNKKAHN